MISGLYFIHQYMVGYLKIPFTMQQHFMVLVLLAFWEDDDLGITEQASDKNLITSTFFCFVS